MATFERAVAAARQGTPAVPLVGGDAGIGKSTLVTEGARRAAAELFAWQIAALSVPRLDPNKRNNMRAKVLVDRAPSASS